MSAIVRHTQRIAIIASDLRVASEMAQDIARERPSMTIRDTYEVNELPWSWQSRSLLVDPERAAAVLEQFTKIERKFTDDAEVALVLEGLASGMKGPEIQHDLQITETQYETIMTRLRRGVDREQGWRP